MIKKSNSTFVISKTYIGNPEDPFPVERTASITLRVNYLNSTFDIDNSQGNQSFKFCVTSHKWREWLAVLECIKEAIEFANKELEKTV